MTTGVLLDTSFFIRLIDEQSVLKPRAAQYFHLFSKMDYTMFVSAISIAEYCVGGNFSDLPNSALSILPFGLEHAEKAGDFAAIVYRARKTGLVKVNDRILIPNDTKLFAQADTEPAIKYYISSDTESLKIYQALQAQAPLNFEFIDLNQLVAI